MSGPRTLTSPHCLSLLLPLFPLFLIVSLERLLRLKLNQNQDTISMANGLCQSFSLVNR